MCYVLLKRSKTGQLPSIFSVSYLLRRDLFYFHSLASLAHAHMHTYTHAYMQKIVLVDRQVDTNCMPPVGATRLHRRCLLHLDP